MEIIKVLVLAVVQGVAEFLPISSSGHLAVLGKLFGFDPEEGLALGIVLHAGTLLSILVFYWSELLEFLHPRRFRLLLLLILATIPAGLAGVLGKKAIEGMFGNLIWVGVGFLMTAMLLWFSTPRDPERNLRGATLDTISPWQALGIGIAQAIAIWPGISRSGSTITTGLLVKLERETAMRFSFLLAIPVIGGAAALELKDLIFNRAPDPAATPFWLLALGFTVSAVVGYWSLRWLKKLLAQGRLAMFSWYLLALGVIVILWQLFTPGAPKI